MYPSLGMDGSKEPINPLTALPKCLQSCKPTRVPGLTGGMWTWGLGRPHLNSAPFLAPTKQSSHNLEAVVSLGHGPRAQGSEWVPGKGAESQTEA